MSREFKNRCWTLFAILACSQSSALAQSPASAAPNPADELRRQQERLQIESQQLQRVPDVHLTSAELPVASIGQRIPESETPCFPIERLELRGQDASRFAWLKDVVSGAKGEDSPLGRCLGAGGINVVLKRAQDALVARGFVTSRVLAEPQDVSKGELVLSVLPGRLRDSRLAASVDSRGTIWNAMPANPGDILNIRDIEQALENFRRIPSVEADIQIEPGAAPGESDLVIVYKQRTPYRVNVFVDDSGSKGTGKYQGGVTLSYDNCLALNDLCYVTLNHDLGGGDAGRRGTRGNTVHYSLPFGYWMLGTTVSNNDYFQTVAGANQDYVYSGTSLNAEVKLARLIYRDASRKTTVNVKAFKRRSNNFIDDTEVEVQRRAVGGWEVGINHKQFIGSAILDASFSYKRGSGAFSSLPSPEEAFGEGTSRFAVLAGEANLNVPVKVGPFDLRYFGSWRMQTNRTSLTPQDRFSIGGRYTVRGFDGESSLSAERGWLLRNELVTVIGASSQAVYVALDHGEVGGPSSELLAGKSLTGAAIGLRGQLGTLQYDIYAARPISKPERFRTARSTAGFSLSLSY